MKHYQFSKSSLERLATCSHELQSVMKLALERSPYDFGVTEGIRSESRQVQLVKEGKSTTMNSRHLANEFGLSEACDIVIYINGNVSWNIKHYRKVAQAVFYAAIELDVQIEWGGLWESFIDGPHFQLASK